MKETRKPFACGLLDMSICFLHTEHRWNSLILTLAWLLPLQTNLIEVWNPDLFGEFDSRQAEIQVDDVTAAIRSKLFWCWLHMSQEVSITLNILAVLAEDCPCHFNPWLLAV